MGLEKLQGLSRAHPMRGPLHSDFWSCTFNGTVYHLFTMIDMATKWAECAVVDNHNSRLLASTFIRKWICRFGVPDMVVTDNAPEFTGEVMKIIHATFGSKNVNAMPYHPKGNAVIESFHRTLRKGLSCLQEIYSFSSLNFAEAVDLVLYSYRSTVHFTTHETPAYMLMGLDLRPPVDNDWRQQTDPNMQDRLRFLNFLRLQTQLSAQHYAEEVVEKRNEDRSDKTFQIGDLVLVRFITPTGRIRYAHYPDEGVHKLIPRWGMPHRVVQVLSHGHGAIAVDLMSGAHRKVHITDVRHVLPPLSEGQRVDWDQQLAREVSMFDSTTRELMLKTFWERLHQPQMTQYLPKLLSPCLEKGDSKLSERPAKRRRDRG
eukprot:Selendium_serpulae@DN6397_c0_g1_i8.p2